MIFFKVGVIVIIVLLIKIIANQQEIDEHVCEHTRFELNDMINSRGLINFIIFRCRVFIANIKYYVFEHKKESK